MGAILEHKGLYIFENNDNLFNLVALTQKMECVISPSTGNIHIASNLGIPTIGLYNARDTIMWASRDKNYVILKYMPHQITHTQSQEVVELVFEKLKKLLNII
ncbi:glycosyltransferase family 9 protein [Helicobacter himalayensis]|uniref:glycosyltransferase family 9 protein n=1 Tax=Helicobacter himalayensis TaxID=1591088 RepID=UPI003D7021DF